MSRLWVGGATGFLGSALVQRLRSAGHELVLTSSRGGQVGGEEVVPCDVLDEAQVASSAVGCEGAFLAVGRVSRDPADAEALHRLHVRGTRSALAGLRKAGVRRAVCASTSGTVAVGEQPGKVFTEADPAPMKLIGRWPYYRTKLYGEMEALAANEPGAFDVVVVNPSLLLGPGDSRGSSTGDVRRFLERDIPAVPAGGIALVDVRDAADGMLRAYESGAGGRRYLLSAANLTVRSFMERLSRVSGVKMPALSMPRGLAVATGAHGLMKMALSVVGQSPPVDVATAEMGQCFWYCDSSRARKELGFSTRDVGETLRETVDDLVQRGVAFPKLAS